MRRAYHPIQVDAAGETFEIHIGNPGKPRVYRKSEKGPIRRVPNNDPILLEVAKAFRKGIDEKKAAEERELARKRGRISRFFRWIGAMLAKAWLSLFPRR